MYSISVLTAVGLVSLHGSVGITLTGSRDDICGMCGCKVGDNRRGQVAFSATLFSSKVTKAGGVIAFDKVFVNDGYGYNPSTGIFTCPETGTYQFSWDVLKYRGSGLEVDLYVNAKRTLRSWVPGVTNYESRTGLIILKLKHGDIVCLKSGQGGRYVHGNAYSTFNGMLL